MQGRVDVGGGAIVIEELAIAARACRHRRVDGQ
jgi:hypothetical protein